MGRQLLEQKVIINPTQPDDDQCNGNELDACNDEQSCADAGGIGMDRNVGPAHGGQRSADPGFPGVSVASPAA